MIYSASLRAEPVMTCNYAGGFQKGLQDFEAGAYGANPDKFCYASKAEDRDAFLRAYDEGRDHAYLFKKVKMTTIPQSHDDFLGLVKEARSLQVQIEKPAVEAKALDDRLKALETENKNLKEQVEAMRGLKLGLSPQTSPEPAVGDQAPANKEKSIVP